jgi:hypothetical protein
MEHHPKIIVLLQESKNDNLWKGAFAVYLAYLIHKPSILERYLYTIRLHTIKQPLAVITVQEAAFKVLISIMKFSYKGRAFCVYLR